VLQASLRGMLKVNTSVALGEDYIAPIAYRFQRQHPGLAIDLTLNERFVDLVEEGIDLAVRFGPVVDENLVARRLGSTRRLTVATPAYLRKHGTPKTPAEFARHNCIAFNYAPATEWVYGGPRGETKVKVSGGQGVGDLSLEQRACDAGRHHCGTGAQGAGFENRFQAPSLRSRAQGRQPLRRLRGAPRSGETASRSQDDHSPRQIRAAWK
jgi:DNA-binding transcriptional LysR family regulator